MSRPIRSVGNAISRLLPYGIPVSFRPLKLGLGAITMSKRTFQPNNRRRAKVHGFRLRMRTRAGRAILGARRRKGRTELSA